MLTEVELIYCINQVRFPPVERWNCANQSQLGFWHMSAWLLTDFQWADVRFEYSYTKDGHSAIYAIITLWKVRRKSKVRINTVKGLQLEFKFQHTGTRSTSAWPHHRLYHCPAVFFHHPPSQFAFFPQGKIRRTLTFWRRNYFFKF